LDGLRRLLKAGTVLEKFNASMDMRNINPEMSTVVGISFQINRRWRSERYLQNVTLWPYKSRKIPMKGVMHAGSSR
jgi:hypothetical protein